MNILTGNMFLFHYSAAATVHLERAISIFMLYSFLSNEYIAQMLLISSLFVCFCIHTMMTINLLFSFVLAKRTILLEPLQIMFSCQNNILTNFPQFLQHSLFFLT